MLPYAATQTDPHSPATNEGAAPQVGPGTMIAGRYRVRRFIAAGGMGEVYEVDDALLAERVALKLVRAEVARQPDGLARFADEIRLARRVTHPNVCRLHDVGVDGTRVFFTMELLDGETLGARLARTGPMSVDAARPIVRQLLAGVAAAHDAGVVHADLKPSNVVLVGDRAVITDFGLAAPCCATIGCACGMPHLLGTPAYMAPEQVGAGTLLESTDLFSLGVILFEVLTGRLPWTGDSVLALAHARLEQDAPSPRQHAPQLDDAWTDAIVACLAREQAARPQSAAELAQRLGLA